MIRSLGGRKIRQKQYLLFISGIVMEITGNILVLAKTFLRHQFGKVDKFAD
jgi:hypothetical protein